MPFSIIDAMLGALAVRARHFCSFTCSSLNRCGPVVEFLAARGKMLLSVIVSKVCMLGAPAVRVRLFVGISADRLAAALLLKE